MASQNFPITEPSLSDLLQILKQDIFATMNCVKVGTINAFDTAKKTAEVQLLFKRVLDDGTILSYPVLLDCPVFTLQGGGASIRLPIAAGDPCVVLFSDRNLDTWFQTGGEAAPPSARCHDLSDGLVFVGINSLTSALANYAADEAFFTYAGAEVDLKGGKVTVKNETTSLLALLTGLIDVIKAVTDANNIPLSAASIAALEAYKLQLQTLLY